MFMYLQVFVFELQQNNKNVKFEIEWISNVVIIWTSNAHKNLIWLACRHFFLVMVDKLMKKLVLFFKILDLNWKMFRNT